MVPEACRQRGKPRPIYPTRNYHANVMLRTKKPFAELIKTYLDGEDFLEKLGTDPAGGPQTYHDGKLKGTRLSGRKIPPMAEMQFYRNSMQLIAKGPAG